MVQGIGPIHTKQLILAVLVSFVPMLLIGVVVNLFYIDQIREDAKNDLAQITRDKALSIRQWMGERRSDVILLSSTNYVINVLSGNDRQKSLEEFNDFYNTFSTQYGTYSRVIICDTTGNVIGAHPENAECEFARYLDLTNEEVQISDAFLLDGEAHFLVAAPITINEEFAGRLIAAVSIEALNSITDNIIVGETGEAYLVNTAGRFVTHQHRNRVLTEDHSKVGIIARLISGEEQQFVGEVIDYRGIPVLGAYYFLSEFGWGLVAEQDTEEAFRPLHRLSQTLFTWIILSSIFVAIIAFVLTSNNLKPLAILKRTIERIREGDLDTRFPLKRSDEISDTGAVFNDMLEKLQAAQETLQGKIVAADKKLVTAHEELQVRHEELKQAQERLLHSERLSTMGEVAAGLAHEINNPLSTISMLVNSLGSGGEIVDNERDHAVEVISEEIDKIASMIRRFQDLTHPQQMRNDPVVVDRLVDRTLALMRPKLNHARVNVHVDINDDLPTVIGDERHLGQLMINLIINSVNAMPDGGTLKIIAIKHHDTANGKNYLRLQVCDDGIGITEEVKRKIFNPFFTTRAEGTGLGLLIVARTAERHGGKIDVESVPGKGTTITVDLPEGTKDV